MSLKPWIEIAEPHKDVLEGTFKQSEFAADISQVADGKAPEEYQNAEKFFSRTFITEGMRLLLISVAQRLAGQGGDPVIQLQTAFGGGKTHTMLTVFHLANRNVSTDKLSGIPPILDAAGISELPQANVAVLDGIKLSPSQPLQHNGQQVNTLWGELAWQLLGASGYAKVAQADQDGTSPGKKVLIDLLTAAAPCVILIDELVAFIRQFERAKHYKAGTFDSNISFIQALTEALKSVPNALLLASLPESDLEVGGSMGQRALNSLEKYFARLESVWKPVAAEESFEIVRRRLFETVGNRGELEKVCKSFAHFYQENSNKFPDETHSHHYYERLCRSYPIHPEIFDRLYEDWSTLDKFQRTRGVLQYMAIVIHRLWNSGNRDALIMPSSIPMEDGTVRNKSIHYLPQGWEPVIEKEIDGPRSTPANIDGHDTRFGALQAARRTARTIFLGSAPSTGEQLVRGIQTERILLGTLQPNQTISVFEDVLRRLRDQLHYLYSDKDRFWFDTKPNLRREMESRKQDTKDQVEPLLKAQLNKNFGRNHPFSGIHIFTSVDVPDEWGKAPRMVILPPMSSYSRGDDDSNPQGAIQRATEILHHRGEQPRQKQNRLLFLAADYDAVSRLKDQAQTYLAWKSILNDFDSNKLIYQSNQLAEVKRAVQNNEKTVQQSIREAYKWLLCPLQEMINDKPQLGWESYSLSPAAPNLSQEIEHILHEEEWLISDWSPIHLKNLLQQWYFKEGVTEVSALKLYQDCCNYLYLPRLKNDDVLKNTIERGLTGEFFGFAMAKEEENYRGFAFDRTTSITLDSSALLIEQASAAQYQESLQSPPSPPTIQEPSHSKEEIQPPQKKGTPPPKEPVITENKKHFYATTHLQPIGATMKFKEIIDEVIENFTTQAGVNVKISIDIQATSDKGFDESLQRIIKENCNTLNFTTAEFEEQ